MAETWCIRPVTAPVVNKLLLLSPSDAGRLTLTLLLASNGSKFLLDTISLCRNTVLQTPRCDTLAITLVIISNTIQYLHLQSVHSQPLEPNLRRGQSLGGDGVVGLREGTSEIMCLKMLLKRSQRRATANFNRNFVPQ